MRFLRNSLIAILAVALGAVLTAAPGDPALYPPGPDTPHITVHVADHGWHAGLILSVDDILVAALQMPDEAADEASTLLTLARIMGAGDWLEIGWGDEAFYRADAERAADVPLATILPALFSPTPTVLHVFPGVGPPADAFPESAVMRLDLSEAGFRRLLLALARDFEAEGGALRDRGPGLYGYARFYVARGRYSALMTCNNWVAARLRAAGAPSSWAFSAFSAGLMAELRIRTSPVPAF